MALSRTLIDSYEPALDTAINRTSGSLTINTGDLIAIVGLFVGPATGADFNITFSHTWSGVTFAQIRLFGTDAGRRTAIDVQWVKWTGSNVSGTYTYNLTDAGERLAQIYCYRYTSAGTVAQHVEATGDIAPGGTWDLALASAPASTSELLIGVAYRPQPPQTQVYVVSQAGWSVIQDHAAADTTKGRVFVAAGTAGQTATMLLDSGSADEYDHTGVLLEITQGDVSANIVPAVLHAGGKAVTYTPGATTFALTKASRPLQARPVTPTPGPISVALAHATVAVSARVVDKTSGIAVTLGRRSLVATARPVTIQIGSPQSVTLGRHSLVFTARPVTITRGPISVGLTTVSVGLAPRPVVAALSVIIPLARRSLHLSARPVGVTIGGVSRTAAKKVMTLTARPLTVTRGPTSIALVHATVHAGPRPVTTTQGATSRTLARKTLHFPARPVTVTVGARTISLVRVSRPVVARVLTISPGAAPPRNLAHGIVHALARPVTTTGGPTSRTATRATFAAVARPVLPKGSGVTVVLGRRSLVFSARPVVPSVGPRAVPLVHCTVHTAARPAARATGPVAVTLRPATVRTRTGSVDPDPINWRISRIGRPRVVPE